MRSISLTLIASILLCAGLAHAAPTKLSQQGRVLDVDGLPFDGVHAMVFTLFDAEEDGELVWTETQAVDFDEGYYAVVLGTQVPLEDGLFGDEPLWLEVEVDGITLEPRHELVSVPFSLRATAAEHVEGGLVDAAEVAVDGVLVIDSEGNWVGPSPAADWADLTGVPTGLDDGDQDTDTLADLACSSGEVAKWDGAAWSCAEDIDSVDPNTDALLSLACSSGEVAKWDGSAWGCAEDIDSVDPNTDALLSLTCSSGEVAKWDGSAWSCAEDIDSVDPNTDELAGLSCLDGQIARYDFLGDLWLCADETVTTSLSWLALTDVPAGLDDGDQDTDTLADLSCSSGDVAKWDGSAWSCAEDVDSVDPNTDVLAGLSCLDDQVARYDFGSDLWTCDDDTDTQLSDAEVQGIVTGDPIDLASGSTLGGESIATGGGVPAGVILMWSGALSAIPTGWALCDGTSGTPNLLDRFIASVPTSSTEPGGTGGANAHDLSHTHDFSGGTSHVGPSGCGACNNPSPNFVGGHSHSFSGVTDSGGSSSVDLRPSYYHLAFIMKL